VGEWDARLFCEAEDERQRLSAFVDPVPLLLVVSRHMLSIFTDDPFGVEVDLGVVTKGARGSSCQSLSPLCLQSPGIDGVADGVAVVARLLRSRGVTGVSCLPANKGTRAGGGIEGDGGLPSNEGKGISTLKALRSLGAVKGSIKDAAGAVSWSISCDGSHADMRAFMSNNSGVSWVDEQGDQAVCSADFSACSGVRGGEGRATDKSLRSSISGIGGDNGEPGVFARSCKSFGVGGCGDKQMIGNEGLIADLFAGVGRAEVSAEASDSASGDVARAVFVGVFNSNWCFVDAASAHVA